MTVKCGIISIDISISCSLADCAEADDILLVLGFREGVYYFLDDAKSKCCRQLCHVLL